MHIFAVAHHIRAYSCADIQAEAACVCFAATATSCGY
jgi:hypothetical protein